jgi:EAL domain-containing protein (putative c-di-GMP-specific phosphodiesterase class I)
MTLDIWGSAPSSGTMDDNSEGTPMRFFANFRPPDEALLWSRDIRYVRRLAVELPGCRLLELESGTCLIGPAAQLTDVRAAEVARTSHSPEWGLVQVDPSIPASDRYLVALASAVQISGIADRIGMGQSVQVAQTKMLDLFFRLHHGVAFQPIVELPTGRVHEYECLFRPVMPTLQTSISTMVEAAINTGRSVELDTFIVTATLARIAEIEANNRELGQPANRYAVNFTPASLLDPRFSAAGLSALVADHGIPRRSITIECTEQQAVSDIHPLTRQAKALRRLGFGFAVDDAGAGYASFTLIAALRPSIIKIDRAIVHGVADKHNDAKRALIEAFVSFGRRIGARLVAEGIETRRELAMLTSLGVEYGQGYLLGRPADRPRPARVIAPEAAGSAEGARSPRWVPSEHAHNPSPAAGGSAG